ncbi:MAG: biopolymer transporter Tol [Bacteroidetes bacterium]|nr:biopolymer transporter Tol [Bacteroidota bacterium]
MRKIIFLIILFSKIIISQEEHINNVHVNWKTIETNNFLIHYYDGTERSANVISKIAEEIYEPITSLYNYKPDSKISIIIKDFDDYSNGAAYFYDNKIEIYAPSLDFDLRGTHNWLRNVVTHEFTHIIQMQCSMKFGRKFPAFYLQMLNYEEERRQDVLYGYPNAIVSYPISGFNVPSWFAEGVAQFNRPELNYDHWDSHRDMILRVHALNNKLLSWNEMSVFGKNSLGNESSYNAGFSLASYIHKTYGDDAIPKISRELAKLSSIKIDDAIQNTISKTGVEIYHDWKNYITELYSYRTQKIKNNLNEGKIILNSGFGNFYPTYSASSKKIAYTSTKQNDYFNQSSLYVYDVESKKETEINDNISSALAWDKSAKRIYYSKNTRENKHFSELSDLYFWDFENEKEVRITFGTRAMNPTLSEDEKIIAFVFSKDGTSNLGIIDINGKNFRQLTNFTNGELCSMPKYSKNGSKIIFGFSNRDAQDIAEYSFLDSTYKIIINGLEDERHPNYSEDEKSIYYSSDKTGIYNLYKYEIETKNITQITNVIGGAFYPTENSNGKIIFALYNKNGFVISEIDKNNFTDYSNHIYLSSQTDVVSKESENYNNLKYYNDHDIKKAPSKNYENIFTSMSLVPLLRFDNYNKINKGYQNIKPGIYFSSSDVLNKFGIFGGIAINSLLERDLFISLEYRDKLPIFYQIGLAPTLSLQYFNVTRKNNSELDLVREVNKFPLNITYSLSEVNFSLEHHIFSDADFLTFAYVLSNYSVDISSFTIPGDDSHLPLSVPGSTEKYYTANSFYVEWNLNAIKKSTTMDINPVGRKFKIKYEKNFSEFNSTGEYEDQGNGNWLLKLSDFNLDRAEIHYREHLKIPSTNQTFSISLQANSILNQTINQDFYYYYAGGLIGMKGYPFYSIGGNEMAIVNATYRFPIYNKLDFNLAHIQFEKIYASIFYDFGNAWNGKNDFKNWKRDYGAELRLEMFSFYSYPTRIFFNAAYGIDKVNFVKDNQQVIYNPEWRYYFGVLFGFDVE